MSPTVAEEHTSEWLAETGLLVIDVPTAADLLGISRSSGYEAARRGELPTIRLGRRLVVPVAKLRTMLGVTDSTPSENSLQDI